MLTQSELKEVLHYNPDTGVFTWLVFRGSVRPGKVAGAIGGKGYINIELFGKSYKAHRLAHFYMLGVWPDNNIDHWDLNRSNNAWSNLREATHNQNQANKSMRSDNTSGYKGVYPVGRRFIAQIRADGARAYLGSFDTPEEAHAVYCAAAKELHGEFARLA